MDGIRKCIAIMTCLLAWAAAMGETLPSAPETPFYSSSIRPVVAVRPAPLPYRPTPRFMDYALYGSIAGYRALDYLSTRSAMAAGAHEVVLPQWVVTDCGAFMAFEGIATATEVGGSIWLIRHRHRRMARTINLLSIGIGVQAVAHNYRQQMVSSTSNAGP